MKPFWSLGVPAFNPAHNIKHRDATYDEEEGVVIAIIVSDDQIVMSFAPCPDLNSPDITSSFEGIDRTVPVAIAELGYGHLSSRTLDVNSPTVFAVEAVAIGTMLPQRLDLPSHTDLGGYCRLWPI